MVIEIKGEPKPKQSARFRVQKSNKTGKDFVMSYQSKEVKQSENNIRSQVISQLPLDWQPLKGKVVIKKLHYVFAPLKSMNKRDLSLIAGGGTIFKDTKPDLTDNLNKGLFDALEGILYINDSQICSLDNVKKYYGFTPKTIIEIEEL